jgi:hypothetical protein
MASQSRSQIEAGYPPPDAPRILLIENLREYDPDLLRISDL